MTADTQAAATGQAAADPAGEGEKRCRICELAPGLLILGVALVLGFIGADLASGGKLSLALGGGQEASGDDSS